MLTREGIRSVEDLPCEKVPVPEWAPAGQDNAEECCIYIRTITSGERDSFDGEIQKRTNDAGELEDAAGVRALLVTLAAVDEDRRPLFEPADWEWLADKSAKVIDRVYDVAARLAGIRKEDLPAAKND
jgi:hypothetical protein